MKLKEMLLSVDGYSERAVSRQWVINKLNDPSLSEKSNEELSELAGAENKLYVTGWCPVERIDYSEPVVGIMNPNIPMNIYRAMVQHDADCVVNIKGEKVNALSMDEKLVQGNKKKTLLNRSVGNNVSYVFMPNFTGNELKLPKTKEIMRFFNRSEFINDSKVVRDVTTVVIAFHPKSFKANPVFCKHLEKIIRETLLLHKAKKVYLVEPPINLFELTRLFNLNPSYARLPNVLEDGYLKTYLFELED